MSFFTKLASRMNSPSQDYQRVGEEMTNDYPVRKSSRTRSILKGTALVLLISTCMFVVIWWPSQLLSAALANPRYTPTQSTVTDEFESVHHCGPGYVEEAKKLGCTWDVLASSWVPQRCIDHELSSEFRDAGDWHYYEDKAGTNELTEDELQYRVGPNMTYFTTLRWHRTYCSYQWRKMHRAIKSGRKMESELANYDNTLDCGEVFLREGELDELLAEISVGFSYC
ncbi:MAG: hypothetical protein MMC23_003259 [Stictis urceolatum]|nr:hypothetical protein [Stictis urceolata]